MEEIFHKLPYEALARCKSVCKTWNSIISCPNFVDDHYNRCRLEGNTHLIFSDNQREIGLLECNNPSMWIKTSPLEEDTKESKLRSPRLIGSYNGLVAILTYDKLILWNPMTKQHSFCDADFYRCYYDWGRVLYGLCYDSIRDEYSVVVGSDYQSPAVTPTRFDNDITYESITVMLHNFKYGSSKDLWRTSLNRRLLDRKLLRKAGEVGKVICGVPHWVVQYYDFVDPFVKTDILYFDLNEEVFKEIDRPSCCVEKELLGLAAMNGEIELGCVVHDVATSSIEVWVMKEYMNVESWTNLLTISSVNLSHNFGCIKYMDVMGFMPNNGELFVYLNDEKLLVYDVYKGNFKEINLEGIKFKYVITFAPGLISPPYSRTKFRRRNTRGHY